MTLTMGGTLDHQLFRESQSSSPLAACYPEDLIEKLSLAPFSIEICKRLTLALEDDASFATEASLGIVFDRLHAAMSRLDVRIAGSSIIITLFLSLSLSLPLSSENWDMPLLKEGREACLDGAL